MNKLIKTTLAGALIAGSAYGAAYAQDNAEPGVGDSDGSTLGQSYMEMQAGESDEMMNMIQDVDPMNTYSTNQVDVYIVPDDEGGRIKIYSYLDESGNRVILDRVHLPN